MRVYKKIALFRSQHHSGVTGTHSNTEKMLILTTLLSGRVDFILFLGIIWIPPQEMRVTYLRKFRMNLSVT